MKMKNIAALTLSTVLTAGCTSTAFLKSTYDNPGQPGYITTSLSKFDNKSMLSMTPAYLYDIRPNLRLGLRWNSLLDEDKIIMIAEWGAAKNFDPKSTLDFNIDGEFVHLTPIDSNQYGIVSTRTVMSSGPFSVPVELGNQTRKTYWASKKILEKIINAKKVVVRAQLLDSYSEAQLEPDAESLSVYKNYPFIWAKGGFKKFLKAIPANK